MHGQNQIMNAQTKVLSDQNTIYKEQTKLLAEQTLAIHKQTELFTRQTQQIDKQNRILDLQTRISEQQINIDLHKKRSRLYRTMLNFTNSVWACEKIDIEKYRTFEIEMRIARFIVPDEWSYIDEYKKHVRDFIRHSAVLNDLKRSKIEHAAALEKYREEMGWIENQHEEISNHFERYLEIKRLR